MEIFLRVLQSWKTSTAGTAAFIIWLLGRFDIIIPQDVATSVAVVLFWVVAMVAKDGDVSHTQR